MKRKYFSALLMGALTVASVSTMTSCKDYDDDINGLSTEITNQATRLDKLVDEKVQNLTKELTTLKEQQSALESALSTAKGDLNTAIEAAKTDAKKYADVQAEAAKVAAIDAAKKNVEDAINVVNASLEKVNKSIEDLNSKVTTNEEKISGLLKADADLQKAIDVVAADAKAAADAAAAAQKTADANAQTIAKVTENLLKVEKDMKEQITLLDEAVKKNTADIAQQKSDVDNQLAQVNKLIEANNKAIEELKGVDANLDKKLDAQAKELKKVADDLLNLQAQVEANLKTAQAYTDTQVAALEAALGVKIEGVKAELAGALTTIAEQGKLIEKLQKGQNDANALIKANHEAMVAEVAKVAGNLDKIKGELTVKIDANKADIDELQDKAGKIQDLANQNKADIATLKDEITRLTAEFSKYVTTETFDTYKGAVKDQIDNAVSKMAQDLRTEIGLVKGDDTTVKTIQGQIDDINEELKKFASATDVAELQTAFSELTEQLTNKFFDIDMSISEINNKIDNIIADYKVVVGDLAGVARQLKALVFSPEAYWQGIEAIDVNSFEYNAKQVAAADLDKDQTSDAPALFTPNVAIKVVPEVCASYFLNPSNAAVDFDASKYSFIVNNAKVSRASSSDIKVSKVEAGDAVGKINVYFNMADATKLLNGTDDKIDVAALRYRYSVKSEAKDTIVTSDFAALKKYRISGFSLRKVATEGTVDKAGAACTKLAATAAKALESTAPTLSVAYKNDAESGSYKTIDLDKWIDVHYSINSAAPTLWGGQTTVNKKNFHLEYETIGYISGANNTNESKHAKLSGENGHILEAVGVNNENGRQIIGRTPLLRVKLVDDNSKKIAAVGYIKVVIEDIAQKPITIEDKFNADKVYTVGCSGNDVLGYNTTWEQIENEVLGDLDMSKSEFEGTYKLDATNSVANQYMIDANGKFVANTSACGTIKYSATDAAGHQTNILTWGVSEADAYKFFITEKKAKVETWIKFTPKNATTAQLKDIYVKFVWTPVVNKDPKVTVLSNDIKKFAAWHLHESASQGWDELEMEVGNATQAGDPCDYKNLNIASTFTTQPLEYIKEQLKNAGYENMAAAAQIRYQFVENNYSYPGHVITVETNAANSKVYSNGKCIATLSPAGIVYLSNNEETKALLNMYKGAQDLMHALTFTVQAKVSFCDNADKLVTVNADKFNVRVIKPIAVNGDTDVRMELNNQSTLTRTVDLGANLVDFNGYSQYTFFHNSGNAVKFVDYYEITGITVDEDNITTNYSNGSENPEVWKEVDPADFTIKLTPKSPLAYENTNRGEVKDWGTVTLKQINQNRPASFKVLIPVKISYKWGTCKTNVIVTVKNAGTNLAKKH